MPNYNQPLKILAVKPGTKYLGIAVLEGDNLIYWRNKSIRDGKMPASQILKRFKRILNELIDFWSPEVLAVESLFYKQSLKSSLLNSLVKEIKAVGKEKRIKVCFHSPPSARTFVCRQDKPTKMNLAKILAARHYPVLAGDYEKEKEKPWWKAKYRLRIFDAIAVGLLCLHETKK